MPIAAIIRLFLQNITFWTDCIKFINESDVNRTASCETNNNG